MQEGKRKVLPEPLGNTLDAIQREADGQSISGVAKLPALASLRSLLLTHVGEEVPDEPEQQKGHNWPDESRRIGLGTASNKLNSRDAYSDRWECRSCCSTVCVDTIKGCAKRYFWSRGDACGVGDDGFMSVAECDQ